MEAAWQAPGGRAGRQIQPEVFDRGTVINSISTVGGRRIAKLSKFVKLYHTPTEPPSVLWENLGVHRTETQKRLTRTGNLGRGQCSEPVAGCSGYAGGQLC